ncbi:MAG: formate dehydrogenase accessory protein FdhE [Aquificae bacterium]|nr:formate dehydrogenase accessory protein FdhE [Aquificota bacterium]
MKVDNQLARIEYLKEKFPEAKEILDFVGEIINFQNSFSDYISMHPPSFDIYEAEVRFKNGKHALDLPSLYLNGYLPYLRELIKRAGECGTDTIREGAGKIEKLDDLDLLELLRKFLKGEELSELLRMLFIAFLQPVMYKLRNNFNFEQEKWLKNVCPLCGNKPSVSYLKDTYEWEGARFLRCSLCLTDWLYNRTRCASCGNDDDSYLSYFIAQEAGYIEIQTCSLCNKYIKVVDLRKDGLAVPHLEDIASVSLDLWAKEKGFEKVERNLLGL